MFKSREIQLKQQNWFLLYYIHVLGICVEGHKRNALHLNLFSQYDVCENASWVERFCPENSLFWNVIQCCIPITEFPSMANCIQADDYSNR